MTTQLVCKVDRATEKAPEGTAREAVEALVLTKVEAASGLNQLGLVKSEYHPMMAALYRCYADHRPLVLSPDMLWLMVAQGFAQIVNQDSDQMRKHFVKHEGKKELHVRRDDLIKGSPENDWESVFAEFSQQLRDEIGENNHDLIVVPFSTTGPVEKAANEVVLMDAMQNYFEYHCSTLCGIPEVTLEGTAEDWQKLRDKTEELGKTYEIQWWTDKLVPILDRIAANSAGADDPELWANVYKRSGGSGGPYVSGWMVLFFPYLKTYEDLQRNHMLDKPFDWSEPARPFGGINTDSFPGSLAKAPFIWHYYDQEYQMDFLAGFIGYTQDEQTLAIRPKIGWAVRDQAAEAITAREPQRMRHRSSRTLTG